MPVYDPRELDPYAPAPNVPPTSGDGGGPPAPGSWQVSGGPEAPVSNGGGGGGYVAPTRPVFGGANIPGAPKFEVDPFKAPDQQALLSDPGYLARLDTGSRALDRSAAARGSLRGGAQIQAQQEYGQNFGAQEYQNAYKRAADMYDRYYQGRKDAYAPEFARWQQQADLNKQAGLMGYQADINHWLSDSGPHYAPQPDFTELLGPEVAPPTYGGGGGYDAPEAPNGYGQDPRRRGYDY